MICLCNTTLSSIIKRKFHPKYVICIMKYSTYVVLDTGTFALLKYRCFIGSSSMKSNKIHMTSKFNLMTDRTYGVNVILTWDDE